MIQIFLFKKVITVYVSFSLIYSLKKNYANKKNIHCFKLIYF